MVWSSFSWNFLFLKHSRQCIHFCRVVDMLTTSRGTSRIFLLFIDSNTSSLSYKPCSNMPQAFGNDITSAVLIETTNYISMNSNIHVHHRKAYFPKGPRVKIDRGVSKEDFGQTHAMLWHTFLLFLEWMHSLPDWHVRATIEGPAKGISILIVCQHSYAVRSQVMRNWKTQFHTKDCYWPVYPMSATLSCFMNNSCD